MPRCYQAPSAAPSDPAARLEVVTELGPLAQAGTVEDAAQQGDAVVLSIPPKAVKDLPDGLLRGKVHTSRSLPGTPTPVRSPTAGGPNLTPPSTGASTSRIRQFPKTT